MSIHVKLREDQHEKLRMFADARKSSISASLRYAVDKLLEEEEIDPGPEKILKNIIEDIFVIPRGYKLRSFFLTLYMLGTKYPEASSRACWGPSVYTDPTDRTNRQVLEHIMYKRDKALKKNGKAE